MNPLLRISITTGLVALALTQTFMAPAPAQAAQTNQQMVLNQSHIRFVSRQMGVPVEGTFKRFGVGGNFDPRRPDASSITIHVDLSSVDIGNADTEAELKKPGWFDSVRRPMATFKSSAIKPVANGRFDIVGSLTIKGQSMPVTVPVQLVQKNDFTSARGSLQIKRMDYRIGDGEWNDISIVANEVQINFQLTLVGIPPL